MPLIIVESPTKAKKISSFLPAGWTVKASVGHIRDLPKNDLAVSRTDYGLTYEIIPGKNDVVAGLRAAAKNADEIYLATDPDREGEAIAWHLSQVLHLKNPISVKFHEITKSAVLNALKKPGKIDINLVRAQEARRALDRLVGYEVSSSLRSKMGRPMSAGRVQTVGLRLIIDRDAEISSFISKDHYGVQLTFSDNFPQPWTAVWLVKPLLPKGEELWTDRDFAEKVAKIRDVIVSSLNESVSKSSPPPPFTTSTLQQAASNRLKYGAAKTMQLAQKLFELGLITYHRTDSLTLAPEALDAIRTYATEQKYDIAPEIRTWKSKANAQEAHEAIRPTDITVADALTHPDASHRASSSEEQALYALIRDRTIASQLADAEFDVRTAILDYMPGIEDKKISFSARGVSMKKAGWRIIGGGDATDARAAGKGEVLPTNLVPKFTVGDKLHTDDTKLQIKKTEPPARFTEATLIKTLEENGVGRPSTYSSIVETIKAREYVEIKDRKFFGTELGTSLIGALKTRFDFVEIAFSAEMESKLDLIAEGNASYFNVVHDADVILVSELQKFVGSEVVGATLETAGTCPVCNMGMLAKRLTKPKTKDDKARVFWGCTSYPKCKGAFPDLDGAPNFVKRAEVISGPRCPTCLKSELRLRKGARGDFWGCGSYPKCKATFQDHQGQPMQNGEPLKV